MNAPLSALPTSLIPYYVDLWSQEAKKPERNIPIGIIASLSVCALSYILVSGVMTLMVPTPDIDTDSPLAAAFGAHNLQWAKTIVSIGALSGLSTSLMASLFPLPRIIYAIAGDGLLFAWLGKVSPRFKTPANATLLSGFLAAVMAFIFDISALADMMSIGTLMSYTLVGLCVLLLRFREYSEPDTIPGSRARRAADPLDSDYEAGDDGAFNGISRQPLTPAREQRSSSSNRCMRYHGITVREGC